MVANEKREIKYYSFDFDEPQAHMQVSDFDWLWFSRGSFNPTAMVSLEFSSSDKRMKWSTKTLVSGKPYFRYSYFGIRYV